ncbi:hypothetical protein CB1_000183001 [Camelus ferus]|nr:hypothetical protein CB1_000183001 [Camelus ferus]
MGSPSGGRGLSGQDGPGPDAGPAGGLEQLVEIRLRDSVLSKEEGAKVTCWARGACWTHVLVTRRHGEDLRVCVNGALSTSHLRGKASCAYRDPDVSLVQDQIRRYRDGASDALIPWNGP